MELTAAAAYEAWAPAVAGYFRAHRMRDAEDLTGDVFVNVARGISKFRGDDDAFRRWVFTIAHHRLIDEYRRVGRSAETTMADVPEVPSSMTPLADEELITALATLTDEQRQVVTLRFLADLSLRDVAKIIDKRPGAVKMLQARGLGALKTALKEESG